MFNKSRKDQVTDQASDAAAYVKEQFHEKVVPAVEHARDVVGPAGPARQGGRGAGGRVGGRLDPRLGRARTSRPLATGLRRARRRAWTPPHPRSSRRSTSSRPRSTPPATSWSTRCCPGWSTRSTRRPRRRPPPATRPPARGAGAVAVLKGTPWPSPRRSAAASCSSSAAWPRVLPRRWPYQARPAGTTPGRHRPAASPRAGRPLREPAAPGSRGRGVETAAEAAEVLAAAAESEATESGRRRLQPGVPPRTHAAPKPSARARKTAKSAESSSRLGLGRRHLQLRRGLTRAVPVSTGERGRIAVGSRHVPKHHCPAGARAGRDADRDQRPPHCSTCARSAACPRSRPVTQAAVDKAVAQIARVTTELLAELPERRTPPPTEPPLRRLAHRH